VPFNVHFRDLALQDLLELSGDIQKRIARAIENRLTTEPEKYGLRLRRTLSNLWKLRVGDYRVVFEIEKHTVTIWCVRHRKDVYQVAERRQPK